MGNLMRFFSCHPGNERIPICVGLLELMYCAAQWVSEVEAPSALSHSHCEIPATAREGRCDNGEHRTQRAFDRTFFTMFAQHQVVVLQYVLPCRRGCVDHERTVVVTPLLKHTHAVAPQILQGDAIPGLAAFARQVFFVCAMFATRLVVARARCSDTSSQDASWRCRAPIRRGSWQID